MSSLKPAKSKEEDDLTDRASELETQIFDLMSQLKSAKKLNRKLEEEKRLLLFSHEKELLKKDSQIDRLNNRVEFLNEKCDDLKSDLKQYRHTSTRP